MTRRRYRLQTRFCVNRIGRIDIMARMTITIPNDILRAAHLDERGLLVELACHLFDTDRLTLHEAAGMTGMTRTDFEDELHDRQIAIHRLDVEDLRQDLQSLRQFNGEGK